MSRLPKPNSTSAAEPSTPALSDLLVPISAFLLRSGFTKPQLVSEWRVATRKASQVRSGMPVVRIGFDNLASSMISRWLRDPKYLNRVGRPDDLPLNGARSISSLLKAGKVKVPATRVLALLIELGTVKKIAPARYRLIRRSMSYTIPQYLPFEPNFQFLIDAARACTWGSGHPHKSPRLYWLNATSNRVKRRHAAEFLRFSKERGLSFIHEINDWLEAHESDGSRSLGARKSERPTRLGMGLFGICSNAPKK